MGDTMRPVPLTELLSRSFDEYRAKDSIFDIPEEHFYRSGIGARADVFSSASGTPIGPAAGPHTQLAQNLLASYLVGARYFELKTVQILDSLEIDKPCIDVRDEGYNVEWSSEFTLDRAYDEYLKAWILLHLFDFAGSGGDRSEVHVPSFLFNMSVGYDLEGIQSARMNRFIDRLIDSSGEKLFSQYLATIENLTPEYVAGTPIAAVSGRMSSLIQQISGRICGSVTLSTMHGCPPEEIESICSYMLVDKNLDTLVKLNPTLLGYDRVRDTLDGLGFGYVTIERDGFEQDLQYRDAVPMLRRLSDLAAERGRFFGVKLSNTLATTNNAGVLPGDEMYLSGRALYPITVNLASMLAEEFGGHLPMSFSGGVSAWNIGDIIESGIRPVTVATDLLRPGGFGRLKEMAEIVDRHADRWSLGRVDVERVRAAAEASLTAGYAAKSFRGAHPITVDGSLPMLDCFVAPCVSSCPIAQDIPEYIHLAGEGRYEEAFGVIYDRNPLPFLTGYLCDHACEENCTRMDWEGAVRIREIKRIAAEHGYASYRRSSSLTARQREPRGVNVAIVGAGPAGLAAASFLAREGFEVHVYEREEDPGGIVRYVIPEFRVPGHVVNREVSLLEDLGVTFHFGQGRATDVNVLRSDGFKHILIGIGAEVDRDSGVEGAIEVLGFLRQFRDNPDSVDIGPSVGIVGAGDTAMDAARAAKRCVGVDKVTVFYRRTAEQMPALREEYDAAIDEGIDFQFLRSPTGWDGEGRLVCTVMRLGARDDSGRLSPELTDSQEVYYVDTVVTAVGEDVDTRLLETMGAGEPENMADVFLIGDALTGASTIVKAIASAREAVDVIVSREGQQSFEAVSTDIEKHTPLRLRRDRITPASTPALEDAVAASIESHRCLGCRELCLKCVEVCPNRANTFVALPGRADAYQIVHLDAFCNECGNCKTFCPWDGSPYVDKFTVFSTDADFQSSRNPGFLLEGRNGWLRADGAVSTFQTDISSDALEGIADPDIAELVSTIVSAYSYLLGPVEL
jgi:putative selenate reductase